MEFPVALDKFNITYTHNTVRLVCLALGDPPNPPSKRLALAAIYPLFKAGLFHSQKGLHLQASQAKNQVIKK